MEDQQALTDFEVGWLCGFFDGEGYVGMNVSSNHSAIKKLNTRRHTIIVPRLVLSNTDYASIMRFMGLLNKAGIGVHVQTGRKQSEKHKPIYRANINGHKRVKKALPIFMSGCVIKKTPMEVLSRWLDHRDSEYHYSQKDYDFYKEFMASNGKSINDSTLRRLFDSCTAEKYKPREIANMTWESRRKRESGLQGNL